MFEIDDDIIEALRQERDELRRQLAETTILASLRNDETLKWMARSEKANYRVEKLTEALRNIAAHSGQGIPSAMWCVDYARQALAEDETKKGPG